MTSPNSEAITIPEILQNVFLHLDRTSLHACSRVSRQWRSWSRHVAWLIYHIPSQDIIDFLGQRHHVEEKSLDGARREDEETDSQGQPLSQSKKPRYLQEFKSRCFRILSLTVGDDTHDDQAVLWTVNKEVFEKWECALPTSLTNLMHLRFGLYCFSHAPMDTTFPTDIVYGLISQNPNLQHLEFLSFREPSYRVLLTALRNNPLQHLTRLEVCSDLEERGLLDLLDLLAVRSNLEDQSQDLEQDQDLVSGSSMSNWNLEELILRSRSGNSFEQFVRASRNSTAPPRPVAVRKLSLLNFCLAVNLDEQEGNEDGVFPLDISFLYHLCRRFPLLQRLQVSSDVVDYKPSPSSFENYIFNHLRDLDEFETWVYYPTEELAREIIKACPNLTEIDLSHHRELHTDDWDILLQHYAPQLESLSAWSVHHLQPPDLVRLVPPSPTLVQRFGGHPSQNWVGLQSLDISANNSLAPAIHMFFKYVPTLRHFKALGVAVEANQLLGYDWVCTGMETLAINILVPTQAWAGYETWRWNVGKDRWGMVGDVNESWGDDECEYFTLDTELPLIPTGQGSYGSDQEDDGSSDTDSESDTGTDTSSSSDSSSNTDSSVDVDTDSSSDTTMDSSSDSSTDSSSDSGTDSESDTDTSSDSDESADESSAPDAAESRSTGVPDKTLPKKRLTYSMRIQIAICQQLGRLTGLKELTLEGRQDIRFDNKEWDCLHLTLQTGLEFLRPLQKNLTRLAVFQLDEELCGRAEMEWIAQNWVHHENTVWQSAFDACSGSSDKMPAHHHLVGSPAALEGVGGGTPVLLCPRFRELLGVSVTGERNLSALEANMNVAWLEGQCRQLTVEKDVAWDHESFFYGQYQDY
ncbi:hypothetical protein BGZ95_007704 [Linnemannia exigua]|uniref:F-box domain-containing protein n=1 Tax=Linnemannia exigua TaxID=604196 RepID=A0AAD4H8V7_9FUNG|nr:hypothetical protein BGZ95_007704 [Linnemannia exigua]